MMKNQTSIFKTNPYTNSTSKQKWSFSKSRRFSDSRTSLCSSFYERHSSLQQRSISFARSKRPSIINRDKLDTDPGQYVITSEFDKPKRASNAGFGTGRDQTKFQNFMATQIKNSVFKIYDVKDNDKGRTTSLRTKTPYPANYFLPSNPQAQRKSRLPGPSSYRTIGSIGQKSVESKHKNYSQRFMSARRFSQSSNKNTKVGPGSYDDRTIKCDGDYLLSNMKSTGKRTMLKGKKESIFGKSQMIPGPGNYDIIGDFGIYVPIKTQMTTMTKSKTSQRRPKTSKP